MLENKELESSLALNEEKNLEPKNNSVCPKLINIDTDKEKDLLQLPKIQLKKTSESKNQNENNPCDELKELESKINEKSKLFNVESFKNKYANKETLKILGPLKSCEKYTKEIYKASTLKINNMLNPYNHLEYSPSAKNHNMLRDKFKLHSEELLRFKHLGRNENKKLK